MELTLFLCILSGEGQLHAVRTNLPSMSELAIGNNGRKDHCV